MTRTLARMAASERRKRVRQMGDVFNVAGKMALLGAFGYKVALGADQEWMWWLLAVVFTAHSVFQSIVAAKFGVQDKT